MAGNFFRGGHLNSIRPVCRLSAPGLGSSSGPPAVRDRAGAAPYSRCCLNPNRVAHAGETVAERIQAQFSLVKGRFGFVDGKNLCVLHSGDVEKQNLSQTPSLMAGFMVAS